jgi:hypothetical protein
VGKDISKQIVGFLSALLLFLGTINVRFEWFTMDSVNALGVVIVAGFPLAATIITIYKNHYGFTQKARAEKQLLERNKRVF